MSEVINPGNGVKEGTGKSPAKAAQGQVNNSDAASLHLSGDASNASKTAAAAEVASTDTKKSPAKRTPSKRLSFIERAQKESEELVRNMGGSLELDGGRRTRSSARGTPTRAAVMVVPTTPPLTKKPRTSPPAKPNASTTPVRARGRGRKLDTANADAAVDPAKTPTAAANAEDGEEQEPPTTKENKKKTDKPSPVKGDEAKSDVTATPTAKPEQPKNEDKQKATDESSAAIVNKTIDDTDATLESIPEEKQNNVDHAATGTQQNPDEPPATGSPMETDEQSEHETPEVETKAETVAKETDTTTAAEISKEDHKVNAVEPTSEPMEVDSNSTSNDAAADIPDAPIGEAERSSILKPVIESAVDEKPSTALPSATAEAEKTTSQSTGEIPSSATAANVAATSPNVPAVKAPALAAANESVDKSKIPPMAILNVVAATNDVRSVPPPTLDTSTANVPVTKEVIKPSTNESNKPENDFCEPKIVSPTTITAGSADGAASAP